MQLPVSLKLRVQTDLDQTELAIFDPPSSILDPRSSILDLPAVPAPHFQNRICRRFPLFALLTLAALLSSGCMHRRLTIRSDPPGAAVLVDGEEIGYTPVSFDYTYYGTREIRLIKDGYQTLTTQVKLSTPWYQILPLEFVTDNFALTKINDRREVSYALARENIEPSQEIENRANNLRSEALRTEMPGGGP
jgi:hypothetical protein